MSDGDKGHNAEFAVAAFSEYAVWLEQRASGSPVISGDANVVKRVVVVLEELQKQLKDQQAQIDDLKRQKRDNRADFSPG